MASPHDATAERIAKRYGVEYNRRRGPDIIAPTMIIEVETVQTVSDAFRQLQGVRKPVYVAGADDISTKAALAAPHDDTIGVMDPEGRILRYSTR